MRITALRPSAAAFNLALKLAFLTLALTLTAASLLSIRQQRIAAANEMVRAHQRVVAHDASLRRIRVEIARSLAPDRVQQMVATLGPMKAIPPEWQSSGGVLVWAPVYTPTPPDAAIDDLGEPGGTVMQSARQSGAAAGRGAHE